MTEQQNQGKISIQQGKEQEGKLVWGSLEGEKEYGYFSEAKEAMEALSWEQAESICGKQLTASGSVLIKCWQRQESGEWLPEGERILLFFIKEQ